MPPTGKALGIVRTKTEKMSRKCYLWSLSLVLFFNLAGKFPVVGDRQYGLKESKLESRLQGYKLTGYRHGECLIYTIKQTLFKQDY
jgi:hypothetical protein